MSARVFIRLKCNDCADYFELPSGDTRAENYRLESDVLRVRAEAHRIRGWRFVERPGKSTRDYCRTHSSRRGLR